MLPKRVPFRCLSHAEMTKCGVGSSQESRPRRRKHVLVLFGAQKLPELAKSIGQSAKILKKEMNDLSEDTPSSDENSTTK